MINSTNILIVTSEFPPQPGGIGNHASNLATQLSSKNFDIAVLADYRSSSHIEEDNFDAIQNFNVIRISRFKFVLKTYLNRIQAFRKYVRQNKPDVIIASGKFPLWLVAFSVYGLNIKKIAVIHGSEVNLQITWQRVLVEKALQKFDQIIAVSNYTKSLINDLNLNTVSVISNGFDLQKFHKTSISEEIKGFPKLITVGNICQRKGQHNVIKILPDLLKIYPEIHYHMVGIPSEKEELLILADNLNIKDKITFHGVVSQIKLVSLLSKSDIFVMLSEQTSEGEVEGFGIAILEANYMGLPTIGSENCGIEDAISNYKSGILVPYDNTEAFVKAVQNIMINMDAYTENSRKWARSHTWEISMEKYIKLIARK